MNHIFLQGCFVLAASLERLQSASVANRLQVPNQAGIATNVHVNVHIAPRLSLVKVTAETEMALWILK